MGESGYAISSWWASARYSATMFTHSVRVDSSSICQLWPPSVNISVKYPALANHIHTLTPQIIHNIYKRKWHWWWHWWIVQDKQRRRIFSCWRILKISCGYMIQSLDIYTALGRIRKGEYFGTQYWTKVYKAKDISVIFFFFFSHVSDNRGIWKSDKNCTIEASLCKLQHFEHLIRRISQLIIRKFG